MDNPEVALRQINNLIEDTNTQYTRNFKSLSESVTSGMAGYKSELEAEYFDDTDISNATHVFAYLYPHIIDELLPKFDEELKKGSRFVSMSFHFTSRSVKQEIDLKRKGYKIAKKIYIYEF
jgi:hypothetical protein